MDGELGDIRNPKQENIALYIGVFDEGACYCVTYISRKYELRMVSTPEITFAGFGI